MYEKKIFKGMINISLEIECRVLIFVLWYFLNKYYWLCCFRDIGKLVNFKIFVDKIEEVLNYKLL